MTDFEWPRARWVLGSVGQVLIRPWLWIYTWRFMPPSLPYIRFRLTTMYGTSQPQDSMDVVRFLEWVRATHKTLRARERLQRYL